MKQFKHTSTDVMMHIFGKQNSF